MEKKRQEEDHNHNHHQHSTKNKNWKSYNRNQPYRETLHHRIETGLFCSFNRGPCDKQSTSHHTPQVLARNLLSYDTRRRILKTQAAGSKIFSLRLFFFLWSRVSYKSILLSVFTEQQAVKQSIRDSVSLSFASEGWTQIATNSSLWQQKLQCHMISSRKICGVGVCACG
jgi:hypothetical protein